MRSQFFYTLLMATGFSFSMEAKAIDDGANSLPSVNKRPCPTEPTQPLKKGKLSEEVQEKNEVTQSLVQQRGLNTPPTVLENMEPKELKKGSLEEAIERIWSQAKRYKLTPTVKDGFKQILNNVSETEIEAYFKKEASTEQEKLTLLRQQPTLTFPVGQFITYLWKEKHPKNPLSDKLLIEMIWLSHPLSPFHQIQSEKIYSELNGKALSTENAQLLKEFESIFEGNLPDFPLRQVVEQLAKKT